ncbi:TetR/AcrR family transcriptional regulator [Sinorhizobium sp. NFACC03]|uniref:TetR/AcrR family transcriptional regulator n=1 Tax=Sinorhizobium sp. NFACC03 TaxID=1566295 RepID=UPI000B85471A|nr:TetR/AcrR family transcriptional regulator [Sinorhizobium sp. NFACC03]
MDIRTAILNSAETRMRRGGFHACSFREIAADVGIKSASVHYYFQTKEDLGSALVARYREKVLSALGSPAVGRPLALKLETMRAVFRSGLIGGEGACLCGILAAQDASLPAAVRTAVRDFFDGCNEWLRGAAVSSGAENPEAIALHVTALLQGALIQAVALDSVESYDIATARLAALGI